MHRDTIDDHYSSAPIIYGWPPELTLSYHLLISQFFAMHWVGRVVWLVMTSWVSFRRHSIAENLDVANDFDITSLALLAKLTTLRPREKKKYVRCIHYELW
jgi:hypothetical protein